LRFCQSLPRTVTGVQRFCRIRRRERIRGVVRPQQQGQAPVAPIGTFSLFLFNQGKAPAREVHVGHFYLPASNVFPDIPRDNIQTPGGGIAIRFPVIPPLTLITISYLIFGNFSIDNVISYVGSEEGAAQRVPVVLQRVFPGWAIKLAFGYLGLAECVVQHYSLSLGDLL
jgi:hypothetical protein